MSVPLIIAGLLVWLSLPRFVRCESDKSRSVLDRVCKIVGIVLIVAGLVLGLLC